MLRHLPRGCHVVAAAARAGCTRRGAWSYHLNSIAYFPPIMQRALSSSIPIPLTWRNTPTAPGHMPRTERITAVSITPRVSWVKVTPSFMLDRVAFLCAHQEHVGHSFMVHSGRDYKRVKVVCALALRRCCGLTLQSALRPFLRHATISAMNAPLLIPLSYMICR